MKFFFLIIPFYLIAGTSRSNAQVANRIIPNCICVPVGVTHQPVSPPGICAGTGSVQFTVAVSGTGPFIYQWRENSAIISDGGIYSGAETPILTLNNPPASMNGKIYRCIITNCNGISSAITNSNAMLTINSLPSDINRDGLTDINDFFLLNLQLFNACSNCPEDINADGVVDIEDFLVLLKEFNRSCQ